MMRSSRRNLARSFCALLGGMLAFGTSACAQTVEPSMSPPSANAAPSNVDVGSDSTYRLGSGDRLRVSVFGEASLSGEFQVAGNGMIDMPLIGAVPAAGLNARELERSLVSRFAAGYLKDPKIAVDVYSFRPYYITGEVNKPGSYKPVEGLTVIGAIATAGDLTYRANKKRIYLRRPGESSERRIDLTSDIYIKPGDVIRVGERYF